MAEKGRQLDLTSLTGSEKPSSSDAEERKGKFLGVHFACCDVYSRIYLSRDLTAYVGNCPRCAKRIQILVGSGGTNSRFFTAN